MKRLLLLVMVVSLLSLGYLVNSCDLIGFDVNEITPDIEELVIAGVQVDSDFGETGLFNLLIVPIDKDEEAILDENITAEVTLQISKMSKSAPSGENNLANVIKAKIFNKEINKPSNKPLAVSINYDASGSLRSFDEPERIRVDGGKAFIDELHNIGRPFEAAVFEYSGGCSSPVEVPPFSCSRMLSDFTDDADELKRAIERVTADGLTPTYGSLIEILNYSESVKPSKSYEKVLILFSDGHPNDQNLEMRRDSVCYSLVPEFDSPIWSVGLGPGNDHPNERNTDPRAVEAMNRLARCSDRGGAYIGLDPDNPRESIIGSFKGFAIATSKGSIRLQVEITEGQDQYDSGDIIIGELTVTSGNKTQKTSFSFRVP